MKKPNKLILLFTVLALCSGLCACGEATEPTPTTVTTTATQDAIDQTVETTTTTEDSTTVFEDTDTTADASAKATTTKKVPTKATTTKVQSPTTKTPTTKAPTTKAPTTTVSQNGLTPVKVAKLPQKTHTVPKAKTATVTLPKAVVKTINGNIAEGAKFTKTYTPARDGYYRFDLVNTHTSIRMNFTLEDALGNVVSKSFGGGFFTNGTGETAELKAGKTYTITLQQYSGTGNFTLNIGEQTAPANITAYTAITDNVAFTDQRNYYTFTPALDGYYRFYLTNTKTAVETNFILTNAMGETVAESFGGGSFENGEGVSAELKAGETYSICVAQYSGAGDYTMNIGKQTETVDISEFSAVKDRNWYEGQRNNYTFTPKRDGHYYFYLTDTKSSVETNFVLENSLEEVVAESFGGGSFENGRGVSAELKAGETYSICVQQYSGTGDYTMNVGKQKETVAITDKCEVKDSMEYETQENVYRYTVKTSGTHFFTFSGLGENEVLLQVFDRLEKKVVNNTGYEGATVKLEAKAGDVYTVYVIQDEGIGEYTMTVK